MRRIIMMLFLIFSVGTLAYGQGYSDKEIKKMAKKRLKAIEKKGGEISSDRDPLYTLIGYFKKLNNEDNQAAQAIEIDNCANKNLCRKRAQTEAGLAYAKELSSYIREEVGGLSTEGLGMEGEEIDKMVATFQQKVSANISGALSLGYGYYIKNGDRFDYNAYFIINEEKAKQVRKNAFGQLKKEMGEASDFLDAVERQLGGN